LLHKVYGVFVFVFVFFFVFLFFFVFFINTNKLVLSNGV